MKKVRRASSEAAPRFRVFPFTALVGQEELKLGLLLNVIDPGVGGLLILGEKGTGKSTAVRALASLLPELTVVRGCPFQCDPQGEILCSRCQEKAARGRPLPTGIRPMRVVELPLGVTEDRLVGALDVEHALKKGEKRFEPGLLAEANRNFLYVDEVNLLEDHLVDLLLDAAAMGRNIVEREGVSFVHPARFILVGTMNPEEGDLRPQLLDRFGLAVIVHSLRDKALRVEVLRRRAAFDADPEGFCRRWQPEQECLARHLTKARERLLRVEIPEDILELVVELTTRLPLDGHRPDIVLLKGARALAAWRGKEGVSPEEVREVLPLAVNHRLKRLPFQEVEEARRQLTGILTEFFPSPPEGVPAKQPTSSRP
uniref:Mg-protoporphyrin IX chelatase n=1 Tax=Desulfobacca acetoxidans TaxID=60893 RepID=A0A7C5AN85_9BACT